MAKTGPVVSSSVVETLRQRLDHKAQTQRPETLAELLWSCRSLIQKARRKGHEDQDFADCLAQCNIAIAPESIQPCLERKGARPNDTLLPLTAEEAADIRQSLGELAMMRKGRTLWEMVLEMENSIASMLEANYSYAEIAAEMQAAGIPIAVATLRKYYGQVIRQQGKSAPSKPKAVAIAQISPASSEPSILPIAAKKLPAPEASAKAGIAAEFNL